MISHPATRSFSASVVRVIPDQQQRLKELGSAIRRLKTEKYTDPASINSDIKIVKEILDDKTISDVHVKAAEYGFIEAGARAIVYLNQFDSLDVSNDIFKMIGIYDEDKQIYVGEKRFVSIYGIYSRAGELMHLNRVDALVSEQKKRFNAWLIIHQFLSVLFLCAMDSCDHIFKPGKRQMEPHMSSRDVFDMAFQGLGCPFPSGFEVGVKDSEDCPIIVVDGLDTPSFHHVFKL
ncbi:hypothetical protein GQ42DRAFT_161920 [Ramicandelaber brevisporus]|nr:hypothetical protein GQ42DRAFT_161920 [Ramicandelaber brevisporus]